VGITGDIIPFGHNCFWKPLSSNALFLPVDVGFVHQFVMIALFMVAFGEVGVIESRAIGDYDDTLVQSRRMLFPSYVWSLH
jgi:hypothetical protein